MIQNKWFKLFIVFLVALGSYTLSNFLFKIFVSDLEIVRIFFNYTVMFICIILLIVFIFKEKNLLAKFGLVKKKVFDCLLVTFIFLMGIVSVNLVLFATHIESLKQYYPYCLRYLIDFSTSFSAFDFGLVFALGILIQIYAAFIEEFIFRGYIINSMNAKTRKGILFAVFLSALLFSLWHFDFTINGFFSKLVLGLVFGACFISCRKNVLGSGILHSLSNLWAPANITYLFMLLFR